MNDIQMLEEMLSPDMQIMLQSGRGKPSVELTDPKSGTTVKIKGVPPDSIVIRPEFYEESLSIFNGTKGECKRADFVIVSADNNGKNWIICIETQKSNSKKAWEITQQLKGACCFIRYCQCIGKSFWNSDKFLDDFECRFVSIVDINPNRNKRRTQPYNKKELHNSPKDPKKIYQCSEIYFNKLVYPEA